MKALKKFSSFSAVDQRIAVIVKKLEDILRFFMDLFNQHSHNFNAKTYAFYQWKAWTLVFTYNSQIFDC